MGSCRGGVRRLCAGRRDLLRLVEATHRLVVEETHEIERLQVRRLDHHAVAVS